MDASGVFAGLNPEQRRAVEAVRGPVCILAGAGSGKTTTITRRIANQVLTGAFSPSQILAVTFTDKAAGELRARLARLGVTGVPGEDLSRGCARPAPPFRPREHGIRPPVEGTPRQAERGLLRGRSGSGRSPTSRTRSSGRRTAASRPPPTSRASASTSRRSRPDLMAGVFTGYERRKEARGLVDFEDLLELAVRLYDEDERARRDVPRPLPRLHGRRVPGRQPPPAESARTLARRTRRPLRRRRRLPVDLLVHRRDARAPPRDATAVSGRDGGPSRAQLPLDAGDPRVREPARANAWWVREGAERDTALRRGTARPARAARRE